VGGAHNGSWKPLEKKIRQAQQARALHDGGMTYEAIGAWLGVSGQTAWRWHRWAIDYDGRPRDARGQKSRKIPRYRNTRGQPPLTQRVRRLRGGGERAASGRWKPREPTWLAAYCLWCVACREWFARPNPSCPRCGLVPASR
jgi:hypothetical protein